MEQKPLDSGSINFAYSTQDLKTNVRQSIQDIEKSIQPDNLDPPKTGQSDSNRSSPTIDSSDTTDGDSPKKPPSPTVDDSSNSKVSSQDNHENAEGSDDDIDGEPIPSGTGAVSKDCSASDLVGWSEILPKWHSKLNQRPKGLTSLVRQGIPEPLRGEVWQLLCDAQQSSDLMNQYPLLLAKTAPTEQIILRDVHRTYPAHEHFRTNRPGSLLDSLFKVCKAYAVYDEEVGYCQGLSFLVASLLLHMPEEQSFCVFVRIMQNYGLRNLFRNNFDELYLKFYQLDHLLEDQISDLHSHFTRLGIEPFMYASQWFLTVFTAKFPLNAVFYIMDIFLLDGMNTIFQVALALLGSSKQELLLLDFEGVLKYFRVQMPKRYRNQENVQQLMNALSEISLKRLKKHAKSYEIEKQKEKLHENPVSRLQRENLKLTENNLRLEQENDDLARELVSSKIQLRAQMDQIEDKNDSLSRSLLNSQMDCRSYLTTISDMEDEKARLEVEVNQLKEVCRRELKRLESELARDKMIIRDYKKICSQFSERHEVQLEKIAKFIYTHKELLKEKKCDNNLIALFEKNAEGLMNDLDSLEDEKHEESAQDSKDSLDNRGGDSGSGDKIDVSPTKSATGADIPTSTSSGKRIGAYLHFGDNNGKMSSESKIQQLSEHVRALEVELARTKLALVESECKCQQLTHEMNLGISVKLGSSSSSAGSKGKLESVKAAAARRMLSMVNVDILP